MKYIKLFEDFSLIKESDNILDRQHCQKQSLTVQDILNNLFIKAGMSGKNLIFWKLGQGYVPSNVYKECEDELTKKVNSTLVLNQISHYSEESSKYGTELKTCIDLLRSMQFIGDKSTNSLYIQFMQVPGDGMSYGDFKKHFNTGLSEEERQNFLNSFNELQGTSFEKLGSIFLSKDGNGRTDDDKSNDNYNLNRITYYSLIKR